MECHEIFGNKSDTKITYSADIFSVGMICAALICASFETMYEMYWFQNGPKAIKDYYERKEYLNPFN